MNEQQFINFCIEQYNITPTDKTVSFFKEFLDYHKNTFGATNVSEKLIRSFIKSNILDPIEATKKQLTKSKNTRR